MAPSVVVLTPNLSGRDGISRLARLITGTFDDAIVVALHEPAATTTFGRARVRGADGRSSRFVAAAVRAAASCDPGTTVIAVHLHLAPAALAFAARGASLVAMLCGVEAWKPLTWIQRAALDRVERLIAISEFTRGRFLEINPHFADRAIDVCHLGVDAVPGAAQAAEGPPSALIVGRMAGDERYKGHDPLLEIWRDVAAVVPDAVLRIVGDGDDRPRLEEKAAALDLGKQVVFLGGLDDEALRREYAQCTALVMPSRDEGFGFVFVEAMRAGRPCVGARGAAGEIIADGDTGWLVAAGDRAQLCDAVVRMLRDRASADAMGARGRVRFLEEFTEARFRDRFTALLPLAVPVLTA
jgi:glycosyltransferase involved in cell wall biosynthesis